MFEFTPEEVLGVTPELGLVFGITLEQVLESLRSWSRCLESLRSKCLESLRSWSRCWSHSGAGVWSHPGAR